MTGWGVVPDVSAERVLANVHDMLAAATGLSVDREDPTYMLSIVFGRVEALERVVAALAAPWPGLRRRRFTPEQLSAVFGMTADDATLFHSIIYADWGDRPADVEDTGWDADGEAVS